MRFILLLTLFFGLLACGDSQANGHAADALGVGASCVSDDDCLRGEAPRLTRPM